MKIGLIQIDGKMPNLALMKLAKFHENKGDDVTYLDISTHKFDRIYGSKIFMGGSGYNIKGILPKSIEAQVPDYEKFNLDFSLGFTSRGCIRDCGFCIVKEKEGKFRDVDMSWIKNSKVMLWDNNFLASPKWKQKLKYFIKNNIKVSFNQGLDIRLINKEKAKLLSKVKYYDFKFSCRRLYFSWDNIKDEKIVLKNLKLLISKGINQNHIMVFILTGYNSDFKQDYYRFKELDKLGVKPFVMVHNKGKTKQLKDFARFVNKRYYKICQWIDYNKECKVCGRYKQECKCL
jgi:hypothetical protein